MPLCCVHISAHHFVTSSLQHFESHNEGLLGYNHALAFTYTSAVLQNMSGGTGTIAMPARP